MVSLSIQANPTSMPTSAPERATMLEDKALREAKAVIRTLKIRACVCGTCACCLCCCTNCASIISRLACCTFDRCCFNPIMKYRREVKLKHIGDYIPTDCWGCAVPPFKSKCSLFMACFNPLNCCRYEAKFYALPEDQEILKAKYRELVQNADGKSLDPKHKEIFADFEAKAVTQQPKEEAKDMPPDPKDNIISSPPPPQAEEDPHREFRNQVTTPHSKNHDRESVSQSDSPTSRSFVSRSKGEGENNTSGS